MSEDEQLHPDSYTAEEVAEDNGLPEYKWIVTTKCATHTNKDVRQWKEQKEKYQGMGLDDEVSRPPKKTKFYQFHIREVESVVEFEDEDFGDITVINKYNGNQVPILEDFFHVARIHAEYNEYKDNLLEREFSNVEEQL